MPTRKDSSVCAAAAPPSAWLPPPPGRGRPRAPGSRHRSTCRRQRRSSQTVQTANSTSSTQTWRCTRRTASARSRGARGVAPRLRAGESRRIGVMGRVMRPFRRRPLAQRCPTRAAMCGGYRTCGKYRIPTTRKHDAQRVARDGPPAREGGADVSYHTPCTKMGSRFEEQPSSRHLERICHWWHCLLHFLVNSVSGPCALRCFLQLISLTPRLSLCSLCSCSSSSTATTTTITASASASLPPK